MKSNTILSAVLAGACSLIGSAATGVAETTANEPMILDMVHHNPGEPRYESRYEAPTVIKEMGYNGKVYFLFDAPTIAVNWESVDPDIFPKGSRERKWVDDKAEQIDRQLTACKDAGIQTFAQADLVLFPKALVAKYQLEETFGDPRDPQTDRFLREMIRQIFDRFPNLDGLVVRIGETYLQDAPYHKGDIRDKHNAEKTIIPLMQLLREEICVKQKKQLIFRTWLSFDTNVDTYMQVNNAVEPHPALTISIKHCEGDFHRGNPFSRVIGMGRHKQLIEVQCAREYEGKGAYPNYVARSVIEGFEEHATLRAEGKIASIRDFVEQKPELYAGIWTWTRGGGWRGPFIKNEMWCDQNAWVMAQWANDPSQSEESIFNRYATERLGLKGEDVKKFRRMSLLTADAVIRGRNSTHGDMNVWWTRDQGIGWPRNLDKEKDSWRGEAAFLRNRSQKDESVAMWKEIVSLAKSIRWADDATRDFVVGSSYYGLHLYEIYRSLVYLADAAADDDKAAMKKWIEAYDKAWADYKALPENYSDLATLYTQDYTLHIGYTADEEVNRLRNELKTDN
jgi:hypothetical protein